MVDEHAYILRITTIFKIEYIQRNIHYYRKWDFQRERAQRYEEKKICRAPVWKKTGEMKTEIEQQQ